MKKIVVLIAVAFFALNLAAQQGAFNGRFSAINPQNNATLVLQLRNTNGNVLGRYSEPGNAEAVYSITGKVKDGVLKGRMLDQNSGLWSFRFTATPEGDGFYFKLDNKFWAAMVPEMTFKPATEHVASDGAAAGLDAGISGNWYYIDTYNSSTYDGNFSYISKDRMTINNSGMVSGNGAAAHLGISGVKLTTSGGQLYAFVNGGQSLLGRYIVTETQLLITDNNGNRKLWKRE